MLVEPQSKAWEVLGRRTVELLSGGRQSSLTDNPNGRSGVATRNSSFRLMEGYAWHLFTILCILKKSDIVKNTNKGSSDQVHLKGLHG